MLNPRSYIRLTGSASRFVLLLWGQKTALLASFILLLPPKVLGLEKTFSFAKNFLNTNLLDALEMFS